MRGCDDVAMETFVQPGAVEISQIFLLQDSGDVLSFSIDCKTKYAEVSVLGLNDDELVVMLDRSERTPGSSPAHDSSVLTVVLIRLPRSFDYGSWELVHSSGRYSHTVFLINAEKNPEHMVRIWARDDNDNDNDERQNQHG